MNVQRRLQFLACAATLYSGTASFAHTLSYSTLVSPMLQDVANGGVIALSGVGPTTATFDESAALAFAKVQVVTMPTQTTNIDIPFTVKVFGLLEYPIDITGILVGTIGPGPSSLTAVLTSGPMMLNSSSLYLTLDALGFQPPDPSEPAGSASLGSITGAIEVAACLGPPPYVSLTASPSAVRVGDYANIVVELACKNPDNIPVTISVDRADVLTVPSRLTIPTGPTAQSTFLIPAAAKAVGTAQVTVTLPNGTKTTTVSVSSAACRGDVDGNDRIDLRDVVSLLRSVAGLDVMPPC